MQQQTNSRVLRKSRYEGGWEIVVEDDLLPPIMFEVNRLNGMRATTGIHADAPDHPMYRGQATPQNTVPTAHLAAIQEFGDQNRKFAYSDGNTPSRPFLRNTFNARLALNESAMKAVVESALNRKLHRENAKRIAQDQAAATRLYIQSEPFEPLADRTKANRLLRGDMSTLRTKWLRGQIGMTDFTPLIESGLIQNSIEGRLSGGDA